MIKKPVYDIFTEAQEKMMSNVVLYGLNLSNICIKHDGMALLSVIVNHDGEKKIEEVADLMYGEGPDEEDVMYLYPKSIDYLIPLVEAVNEAHPEFILDIQTEPDALADETEKKPEDGFVPFGSKFDKPEFQTVQVEDDEAGNDDMMKYRYIKITTAPVTKKVRKIYLDAVEMLYKEFKVRLDVQKAKMDAALAPKIAGYEKKDVDEVKRLADNIQETNVRNLQKVREEKEKEIEEGYQRYLRKHPGGDDSSETVTPAPAAGAGNMLKL